MVYANTLSCRSPQARRKGADLFKIFWLLRPRSFEEPKRHIIAKHVSCQRAFFGEMVNEYSAFQNSVSTPLLAQSLTEHTGGAEETCSGLASSKSRPRRLA